LLVRPGELAIQERNFYEAKIIDEPVEKVCLGRVKVTIRFITGGTDKVEISHDGSRPRDRSKNLSKGVKKILLLVMETRSINVDDGKGEVIRTIGEGGGDREIVDGVVGKLQEAVIPGSSNTSGSTRGRFENKRTKLGRKEEARKEEMSLSLVSCRSKMEGAARSMASRTSSRFCRIPSPRTFQQLRTILFNMSEGENTKG
jgi:hypothetical protein